MSNSNGVSTETSPLIPKSGKSAVEQLIEPGIGVEANAVAVDGNACDPSFRANDVTADGEEIERQASNEGRQKQYEGMPEVRKRMKYILPALAIGVFLSAADQTLTVTTYGVIGNDFDALNKTSWIATAYFITLTSFQPLYGKLSDIFSRKSCLLFAYVIFGFGCLFCGLARNINELIAARAFSGIGGGGMNTVVSILLSDIIPLKERGKWQGYVNIIFATGAGCGAPLGGLLADSIGWRFSFWFQAPLCLVAFFAVALALREPKREQELRWKDKLRRIDFLGAAILVCAVFALLLGLDRGSNVSWSGKVTLVPLCIAFPLFALFLFVEVKIAAEPFAPGHIIFHRSLFACYLCNFFSFAGWLAAIFYAPLYFQAVNGSSATTAGLLLLPNILAGVSGSLFAGFYMQRTGKYYWLTVIAYASLVVGMILILLFSGLLLNSTPGIIIGMVVCAFSNGIGVTSSLIALISNATRADQAVATACSYLFRSLGSTTGVALSATASNQTLRAKLIQELGSGRDAEEIVRKVRQSLSYIRTLEPGVRDVVRRCYGASTRAAFALEVGLVAGAALSAWFVREKALTAR